MRSKGNDVIHKVVNGERRWAIAEGDCLEVFTNLPDKFADVIVTDPPYGHKNADDGDLISRARHALGQVKREAAEHRRPIANDGEEAGEIYRKALPEMFRVLRDPGCCCCCGGGGGPDPQFARWSLWMDEVFQFKQMVVWDKGPIGMGWHYRRSYEVILVGEKPGGATAWYDTTRQVENIIRPGQYGISKIIPSANEHGCAKPWELARHFIQLHTKPGDVVFDPFCGHGWVGEAALRTGRRFVGIEIDPYWAGRARERLASVESQADLFAPVESRPKVVDEVML